MREIMHSGSCLCGAVKYEIDGALAPIQFCHCHMCRRASGTAFAANMPVAEGDFRVVAGAASLKRFESSPGKERLFCAECGSPIISRAVAAPGVVRLRVGTLDAAPDAALAFHFNVASKAEWWPITDDLPQYTDDRPG
jgi:hypothetical protein